MLQICKNGYAETCKKNHYVEFCNITGCPDSCSQCEAGYSCYDGRRTICRPGTYSDGSLGELLMLT